MDSTIVDVAHVLRLRAHRALRSACSVGGRDAKHTTLLPSRQLSRLVTNPTTTAPPPATSHQLPPTRYRISDAHAVECGGDDPTRVASSLAARVQPWRIGVDKLLWMARDAHRRACARLNANKHRLLGSIATHRPAELFESCTKPGSNT